MSLRDDLWHQEQLDAMPHIVTLADRNRKARKKRVLECSHIVESGESYREIVMIVDGEFTVNHECVHCHAEWDAL